MNTLPLVVQLTLLTVLAALITFAWLVIRAFRKNNTWGTAVLLFSPISAVIFGIKYWKADKLPFLACITSSATAIALCLSLFSSWGGWELVHVSQQVREGIATHTLTEKDTQSLMTISQAFDEQSGLDMQSSRLLAQAKKELALQAERLAAEAAAEAEAAGKKHLDFENIARKVKPAQPRYRLAYVTIDVADASNYVGSTVKVTRKNVLEKEYRLLGVSGNRLELAQNVGSGSYSFRYRNRDIERLRVLTKQDY
ncbi:MAG: hypothetical protein WBN81_12060 [Gammaproteobacteria bacterium]